MIVGYHVIFGAYGFWLPNDPRGSWSVFVGAWDLYRAGGGATKTTETRSLAYDSHDRAKRLATKTALSRPAVRFTGLQARAIGRGFATYAAKSGLPVWACAIMPDHVHLVFGRFRLTAENVVIQLKSAATTRLVREELHPFQHLKTAAGAPPKCFAQGEWKVFLDPDDVARAIRYVEMNPVKEGLPPQRWPFVVRPDCLPG
jgi:REP element-mobilizing transposase RayT